MSDNNDFNLDDILSEFQGLSQDDSLSLSDDLDDLLGSLDDEMSQDDTEAKAAGAPMDTIRLNELIAQLADSNTVTESVLSGIEEDPEPETPVTPIIASLSADAPAETAAEAAPETAVSMDTTDLNALIAEIVEQTEPKAVATDAATIRMDAISPEKAEKNAEAVSEDATIRMDTLPEEVAPESAAPSRDTAPRILYNPRTRLRELKRKLVAGPEKRYYELSEVSIGKLQIAILVNLALAVFCGLITTMYTLDMLTENRLRFVIFTQVLSLLLSVFFGRNLIIDGFADLFKGRFTINIMLFFTFLACLVDGVFCLAQLRIPCCAAFSLEMAMALWARYQRHSTEMAQMDTMRKAVRLIALTKVPTYYDGKAGILRREGEVEDFMDHYDAPSGPEKVQSIYCIISLVLCIGIAAFAGFLHGFNMAVQVLSVSLLVVIPASFFVALTRPAALLERRLHMVGSVLCGWRGVKMLRGAAAFPLEDEDLFPAGTTKLNGVKFYGTANSDDVIAYSTALIQTAGGGLVPLFQNLLESRNGAKYTVTQFCNYGSGGIGGKVNGDAILMGTPDFLQDMGVHIPEGTMVSQAVYAAINGNLSAVYAISYAKMRSSAAGLISLCGNRKLTTVLAARDFMLTEGLLQTKFGINTRRIIFPDTEEREALAKIQPEDSAPALALATRSDVAAYAYAISGARALSLASKLGVALHLIGGILGILIMAALAYLGSTDLLTPAHVLLYQLVWMVPGLLITEWTRSV